MGQPQSLRAAIAGRLLNIAIALTFIPLIIHMVLLAAGTFQVNGPAGSRLIGLSSLSIVSFNGIIPSDTHSSYLIHLQYFPSAFTWSYPTSPDPTTTSGILQSGPSDTFDPLTLIQSLPTTLSLPAPESRCLHAPPHTSKPDEKCTSPFWTAVHRMHPYRFELHGHGAYLALFIHVSSVFVILYTLALEACVRLGLGGWMRCRCWWRWQRRMCPLPKGSAEEVARLPGEAWDVPRVWMYCCVVAYGVLAVVYERMVGGFLVRSLGWVEEWLPDGRVLEARLGTDFFVVSWGGVVVAAVAFGCVVVRTRLLRGVEGGEGKGEPLLAKEGVVKPVGAV
ncbi:hypothetical protein B0I37DRAFT_138072 [Chaetomium sp. MPI-CAGE-AT-0009]|nr:hypothetical protein B0I37DRAFT_138072 [Chaetomium sp. MPI-CAGE-AT-0009]